MGVSPQSTRAFPEHVAQDAIGSSVFTLSAPDVDVVDTAQISYRLLRMNEVAANAQTITTHSNAQAR